MVLKNDDQKKENTSGYIPINYENINKIPLTKSEKNLNIDVNGKLAKIKKLKVKLF